MLVGSLVEISGEDSGSWTHIIFTLARKLVWPTLIIHVVITLGHAKLVICLIDIL